jgi:ribbon-helix-helix CopG family protein
MLTKNTKLLAVRLPEADKRRFKSLAASRGISLQEAVRQALEVWASQLQPEGAPTLYPPPGSLAGADSKKPRQRNRAAKRTQD